MPCASTLAQSAAPSVRSRAGYTLRVARRAACAVMLVRLKPHGRGAGPVHLESAARRRAPAIFSFIRAVAAALASSQEERPCTIQ